MAKLSIADNRRDFIKVFDFLSNPRLAPALEKIGKDSQLFRKAKKDPEGYFRTEGVPPLPPRTSVRIVQLTASAGGSVKVTVTVHFCFDAPGNLTICVDSEGHASITF